MSKNRQRLIQLEKCVLPDAPTKRFIALTHFDGETDHKGETMQDGELGYQSLDNLISADPNNALVQGADGGLWVPIPSVGAGGGLWESANQDTNIALTKWRVAATAEIGFYNAARYVMKAYGNNPMHLDLDSGNEPHLNWLRNGAEVFSMRANANNNIVIEHRQAGNRQFFIQDSTNQNALQFYVDGTQRGRMLLQNWDDPNDAIWLYTDLGNLTINSGGTVTMRQTNHGTGAGHRIFVSGTIAYYNLEGTGTAFIWRHTDNTAKMFLNGSDGRLRLYDYGVGAQLDNNSVYVAGFDASGNLQEIDPATLAGAIDVTDANTPDQVLGVTEISLNTGLGVNASGGAALIGIKPDQMGVIDIADAEHFLVNTTSGLPRRILASQLGGTTLYSGDGQLTSLRTVDMNAFDLRFKQTGTNAYMRMEAAQGFWMGYNFYDTLGGLDIASIEVQRPAPQQPASTMQLKVHDGTTIEPYMTIALDQGVQANKYLQQPRDDGSGDLNMSTLQVHQIPNIVTRAPGTGVTDTITLPSQVGDAKGGPIYIIHFGGAGSGTVTIASAASNSLNNVPGGTLNLNPGERAICIPGKQAEGWWTITQ